MAIGFNWPHVSRFDFAQVDSTEPHTLFVTGTCHLVKAAAEAALSDVWRMFFVDCSRCDSRDSLLDAAKEGILSDLAAIPSCYGANWDGFADYFRLRLLP